MSEEIGLSAGLEVRADGVKAGTGQAITSLQALQAEMVKTQAALSSETDTGNIDRLQRKMQGLGSAIQSVSKGSIKAVDVIPPEVTRNIEQQTAAINSATKSVGVGVRGLQQNINRSMHGVAELFIAPGRAANIFANDIPQVISRFKELKAEQQALAAAGKPAASSMSILAQAFDPMNLAIGLGVVLLIKFLPKLIGLGEESEKAATSVSVMSDALKNDKGYGTAIQNVNKLTEDIKLAKEGFLDKDRVVKEYNDTIGKTTGQVDNLNEAESSLVKNKDAYLQMMAQKAAAAYAYQEAGKEAVKAQIALENMGENPSIWEFVKASFKGGAMSNGAAAFFKGRLDDVTDAKDKADKLNKIGDEFEKTAAGIAKKFGFNLFSDDKTGKVGKHVKDVTDVLATLNKSIAETDAQVEAHTLHLSDVAKKNLGAVTTAINDLIKMGIKPSDPIIQGLDLLQNHLKIDTSNKNVINVKAPKINYQVPKIDPKVKTETQKLIDNKAKLNKEAEKKLNEQNKMLSAAIGSSIVGLGEGIGVALASGDFSGMFDGFKTALGSAIEGFGKYIIEQAIIIKLLKSTILSNLISNTPLAIAAGVALVALGAAIKASISSGGKSSPGSTTGNYTPSGSFSGGGGYSSPYSGASASSPVSGASTSIANNIAASIGKLAVDGDFKLSGNDLLLSVRRTQKLQGI